jgi:hypothetical protein
MRGTHANDEEESPGLIQHKMKAATEFRGGNFFVRANDLFRLCKGIWMESFGRISLFPGLAPGIF